MYGVGTGTNLDHQSSNQQIGIQPNKIFDFLENEDPHKNDREMVNIDELNELLGYK